LAQTIQIERFEQENPKRRRRAALLYAFGCLLSVFWGVSADLFMPNPLGAVTSLAQTHDGGAYLSLSNTSETPWTDVKIEVDSAWFYRIDRVPAGSVIEARIADFHNVYGLPRARDLFYWERIGVEREPEEPPHGYSPSRVVLTAGGEEVRVTLRR
jgi:hypothetical protein